MGTTESSLQQEQTDSKDEHHWKVPSEDLPSIHRRRSHGEVTRGTNQNSTGSRIASPPEAGYKNVVYPKSNAMKLSERNNVVKVLRGVVCGHEKVGKSSLLYRLRGEDVVHSPKRQKQRMMALIPWSMEGDPCPGNNQENTNNHTSLKSRYSTTNTAVQLHIVERHEDSYASMVETGQVDFIIFLVDRTRKDTLEYVIQYLNGMKQYQENDCDLPSLCLLLNHYDASCSLSEAKLGMEGTNVQDDKIDNGMMTERNDSQSEVSSTTILNLEHIQLLMKEQFKEQLHVHCFDSCMINGYGLEALNYFMTVSYLRMIERDLLMQMKRVRSDLNEWENSFTTDMFTSYQDIEAKRITCDGRHEKEVDGTPLRNEVVIKTATTTTTTTTRLENVATDGDNDDVDLTEQSKKEYQTSRRKVMFKPDTKPGRFAQQLPQNGSREKSINTQQSRRTDNRASVDAQQVVPETDISQVISKRPSRKVRRPAEGVKKGRGKSVSSSVDPKMALEAFLASDEDSDDGNGYSNGTIVHHNRHRGIRNTAVLYSDSEDDTSNDNE